MRIKLYLVIVKRSELLPNVRLSHLKSGRNFFRFSFCGNLTRNCRFQNLKIGGKIRWGGVGVTNRIFQFCRLDFSITAPILLSWLQQTYSNLLLTFRKTKHAVGMRKFYMFYLGKGAKKKIEKKLTSVSFMYVCVAENGEMLVFFSFFFPNNSLIDNSLSE